MYNKLAYQIFTKIGPIAFLPCSNKQTSIVFSILNKEKKNISDKIILNLINKYNKNYSIKSFTKLEKFELNFHYLKNYYYKNILFLVIAFIKYIH